jgi:uncharacterized OB-fold protein
MGLNAVKEQHFDGEPCKKCGSTLRYVSRNTCVTCTADYYASWYSKNIEKRQKTAREWVIQTKFI